MISTVFGLVASTVLVLLAIPRSYTVLGDWGLVRRLETEVGNEASAEWRERPVLSWGRVCSANASLVGRVAYPGDRCNTQTVTAMATSATKKSTMTILPVFPMTLLLVHGSGRPNRSERPSINLSRPSCQDRTGPELLAHGFAQGDHILRGEL